VWFLQSRLPPGVADLGFRQAMQKRWIKTEKGSKDPKVQRQVQHAGLLTVQTHYLDASTAYASHEPGSPLPGLRDMPLSGRWTQSRMQCCSSCKR
jgi:PheRS DNA binding domain 3